MKTFTIATLVLGIILIILNIVGIILTYDDFHKKHLIAGLFMTFVNCVLIIGILIKNRIVTLVWMILSGIQVRFSQEITKMRPKLTSKSFYIVPKAVFAFKISKAYEISIFRSLVEWGIM